ncbi:unnamed protein product, partial [Trichobilharzia szidati]
RKSRTQLEFLPRAIHRTHESQAGSDQTESSDDKSEVKSSPVDNTKTNEYFRKLFMK